MHRLWLVFAQTVTVALGVLFVLLTFKPAWFGQRVAAMPVVNILTAAEPAPGTRATSDRASYADAAQSALPSVVHIFTSKEVRQQRNPLLDDPVFRHFFGDRAQPQEQHTAGLGSGVVVSSEGYILTNNHVIDAADEIEVALQDGSKFPARIVGRDPETDLAVLRIDAAKLPAITFANSDSVRVGDVVLAIGNPFGVGQTVTLGIVSAMGRNHLGINTFENFIQTDAAINPGNSGGALIDSKGHLIGINTAIYSRTGGSLGIGFAIPASFARDVMEQIIKTGSVTRGWIGVEVQEITPDLASSFGLPREGALISGIARNSPAAKAGVRPGDVLVAADGKSINDAQSVLSTIAALPPGRLVQLRLIRQGKTIEVNAQIARRPLPTANE
ncbi:Do family serine endopeptidase [Uliginosibacterium sp. sgz301328]|uniref:Do family serine endopeptidase n=1 Tax=Uliginosibacterium sp. sgz301328 TaxID=3243764 RepID=UPI00359D3675